MSSATVDWLTADFVEKVLRKSESDGSIKVKDLTTKAAIGKGENFASQMIRANVEYTHNKSGHEVIESVSLILKIAPVDEGASKELIGKFEAFEKEIDMMHTMLVGMNDALNEKDSRLSPRVLHAELGEPSAIVMEDLASLGYRMGDRLTGLDLQHSLLAIRNLAKFHASSVAVCEKNHQLPAVYSKGIFHADYPDDWKQYFTGGMKSLAKDMLNWPELEPDHREYSEKLLKLAPLCYERGIECVNQKCGEFRVLNHGDCWVNNMLFRYDNGGKVIDHIFVDFQLSFWNSLALDVLYFMNTSLAEDVNMNHSEMLLEEYLNTLTETMSRLHCITKPPTREDLDGTLRDYGYYSVIATCFVLPMVLLDKSKAVSYNEIVQEDEFVNPAHEGQMFRRAFLRRLPMWDALGLLDI